MKHHFVKKSAFAIADENLIIAVGRAMVVFAAIEGAINFALASLLRNHIVWSRFADAAITRRLDLFSDLVASAGVVDEKEIKPIITRAKDAFKKRNLIAHNPVLSGEGYPEPRIWKLGGGVQTELTAGDIFVIAEQADEIYDEIWQLFFNHQRGGFDENSDSAPKG